MVAIPEAFEAGEVVEQARAANPSLRIVARAHSDGAAAHLSRVGADIVVLRKREIARRVLEDMRTDPGARAPRAEAVRGDPAPPPRPPSTRSEVPAER